MTNEFDRNWKAMGLTDDDLRALQEELVLNPTKGDLMPGTNGLRKIRIAFGGRGKSGSGRVCYVDFAVYEKIYLITAYPKNVKANLSKVYMPPRQSQLHGLLEPPCRTFRAASPEYRATGD